MNKKEVLEIRKQFSLQNCAITRICGCYVDGDKEKKLEFKEAFLSLPEEEEYKYFDLFKRTLSGTVGKNLLNMSFPLEEEQKGGAQEFLMQLKDSRLTDDMLVSEFYDKVIENYDFGEHYLILLIHAAYDVPGKASDGMEMYDASDTVYDYILCSICPVSLSKAGLCYNAEHNSIEDRIRDWIVNDPVNGFLFPAFNDRASDVHGLLYYSKKPEELQEVFLTQVLGCSQVLSAGTQKESFQAMIADTLGEDCAYSVIRNIHENLNTLIEENKEEPEPLELGKPEVRRLFSLSGVPEENLENFDREFDETVGAKASLLASNIASTKKFNIKTPDIVINVNPDRTDLVDVRIVDGRKCLVIPVDDQVEVNGIEVRMDPETGVSEPSV
ncbi:DUF4317 domain-containing protein [Faecalicatena contorta]|uniref:DUF4317 domain-containing protein n=1 Tax=Faecalicatena fissicatena TaxID=290055 RepID=A0ABS2E513_9FIRM|nr:MULTISPECIES: DUF4317 domain-containing protein [Clostridia]MBM6684228.1 DUF4317 domain-containing protein [Faecalicatena contorta]MBM6709460.1 DUF4317 domain-containing protein [Faecalicatena contorta]MBM6736733.1 DUF4317 domain-containing protein [Faecalicatena fissicatena]HIX98388.1 DUF4317 domain-containing protein [Candidatus Dorea intestinigallinarum]